MAGPMRHRGRDRDRPVCSSVMSVGGQLRATGQLSPRVLGCARAGRRADRAIGVQVDCLRRSFSPVYDRNRIPGRYAGGHPMCGRFTQDLDEEELVDLYDLDVAESQQTLRSRWNGAPTQEFAICRMDHSGRRVLARHRWGLVPPWARDPKIGSKLINARSESADTKPSFRAAFRRRRCLIPANG